MIRLRRARPEREHEEVNARLDNQERELEEMKRRVRLLEIEAGVYHGPQLKEVNGK